MRHSEDDPRVVRLPYRLGCRREEYDALGFVELGDADEHWKDRGRYRLVRMPEGWHSEEFFLEAARTVLWDHRGIRRGCVSQDFKPNGDPDRVMIFDVGRSAAAALLNGSTFEDVQFDRLTPEEIETLVEAFEAFVLDPGLAYTNMAGEAVVWLMRVGRQLATA